MRPDSSTEICVLPSFAPEVEKLYLENELNQLALAATVSEQTSAATENAAVELERERSVAFQGASYRNRFAELVDALPANRKTMFTSRTEGDTPEAVSAVAIRRTTNQKMQYGRRATITSEFARLTHPDSKADHRQDFITFTEARANGNNALAHALLAKYVVGEGIRIVSQGVPDIAALRLTIAKAYSNLGATSIPFHSVDGVNRWFAREKSLLPIDIRGQDIEFLMGIVLALFAEKRGDGFVVRTEEQHDYITNIREDVHDAKLARSLINKSGTVNPAKMADFDKDVEEIALEILNWDTQDTEPYLRDLALTIFSRKLAGLSSRLFGLLERDEAVSRARVATAMAKMVLHGKLGRILG